MSSNLIDPSKLTVEDLFQAKTERRQRLASLPFDQKIEIVNKLRAATAVIKNERPIFESFLRTYPNFAREIVIDWDVVDSWYANRKLTPPPAPFDKRPDIIALTASGRKIGIELKGWVNQEQISEVREREIIQDRMLKVIGKQPPNETKNIGSVWLSPKHVRFDAPDATAFRDQLLDQIAKADDEMTRRSVFEQMSTYDIDHFDGFLLLEKYLHRIRFRPAARSRSTVRWIRFPDASRFYSPNEMLETLSTSLTTHKNDERYKDLKEKVGLDELYLLVHYDFKAFAYNTPFDAPNFGFKDAAEFGAKVLDGDGGYFDLVFLFHFLSGQEKAYRIL